MNLHTPLSSPLQTRFDAPLRRLIASRHEGTTLEQRVLEMRKRRWKREGKGKKAQTEGHDAA